MAEIGPAADQEIGRTRRGIGRPGIARRMQLHPASAIAGPGHGGQPLASEARDVGGEDGAQVTRHQHIDAQPVLIAHGDQRPIGREGDAIRSGIGDGLTFGDAPAGAVIKSDLAIGRTRSEPPRHIEDHHARGALPVLAILGQQPAICRVPDSDARAAAQRCRHPCPIGRDGKVLEGGRLAGQPRQHSSAGGIEKISREGAIPSSTSLAADDHAGAIGAQRDGIKLTLIQWTNGRPQHPKRCPLGQ